MQHAPNQSLPLADAESVAHSARVAEFIRQKIASSGGQISFAEYMQHALYAPGLGYYSAGATKFGAAGDFVTAPEISPVFGQVLARQCAGVLAQTSSRSLLEFGAGSGKLAADILRSLERLSALPERYQILEVSPDLQQRQRHYLRDAIPHLLERIVWLDQLPDTHSGVIVANEVLDALPVERFVRREDGIKQLCVAAKDETFVLVERAAPEYLVDAVIAIERDLDQPLAPGFCSEVSLAAGVWLGQIAELLTDGMVFLFDYGVSRREYYALDRSDGWLRCHFRHRAHRDAMILPGIQDLTAWVDFSALAQAAVQADLDVVAYVTQAHFLINGGLSDEFARFSDLPLSAQLELSGQVKLLTLPGEMGENFKCLGLSKGAIARPGAFAVADRTTFL